jgi:electron transfer flavoprotein beta subunit
MMPSAIHYLAGSSMKILVCMKQVIDTDASPELEAGSPWLRESSDTPFRVNRFDEYALEAALLLKDRDPNTAVHVLSVGPERVVQVVKGALSKGADVGIHVRCDMPWLSALETASYIASFARGQGYDLVFAGVMSEDAMQGQVGPLLAALLALSCAVSVVDLEIAPDETFLLVESELEGGLRERSSLMLPALVTVQTGSRRPRYPSLSNILKAREKTILTVASEGLPRSEPREVYLPLGFPAPSTKGVVLTGTSEEKAEQLLTILHERALL